MTDIAKLRELLARVEVATGPDVRLDRAINAMFPDGELGSPYYTASIDAAVALCKRVLPGWVWRVCSCCVSDDAWIAPDYNCPEHGERLKEEFPLPAERYADPETGDMTWGPFDSGFDIDRRPPGNPASALIEAILQAKIYIAELAEAE